MKFALIITCAFCLTLAGLAVAQTGSGPAATAPAAQQGQDARLPVPDAAAQKEALKLAKEVFNDDMQKAKTAEARSALADKMLQQAAESKDDPAGRYVLLQMAIEQAGEAGDVTKSLDLMEQVVKSFSVDATSQRNMVISKLIIACKLSEGSEQVMRDLLDKESEQAVLKSDDAKLPSQQVKIGDGWWDLAKQTHGSAQASLLARATLWYQRAVPNLSGLVKAKVEKRLNESTTGSWQSAQVNSTNRPTNKSAWTVLFRSSDASRWNTEINKGPDDYSVNIRTAPDDTKWLRLSIPATEQMGIIPMSKGELLQDNPLNGSKLGWNGTAGFRVNAYHLGIWSEELMINRDQNGAVSVRSRDGVADKGGWGFGHHANVDNKQSFSWDGSKLPEPVVFEIAVKTGALTKVEEKSLLTDSSTPVDVWKVQVWRWFFGGSSLVIIYPDHTASIPENGIGWIRTGKWTADGDTITFNWPDGNYDKVTISPDNRHKMEGFNKNGTRIACEFVEEKTVPKDDK